MCFLKMENELKLTAWNEDFFTVEVELKSTPIHEELKSTAMEGDCTTIEEELKLTAMKEEIKCTAMVEELKSSCQICDKAFTNGSTRNKHMRRIHNVEPPFSGICNIRKIICPLSDCREKFFRIATLREHIVQTHKIDLEVEEKTFQSYEDFNLWKENMEKETNSHYVKRNSTKSLRNKGKRKLKEHYSCHRSGFFKPSGTGTRKRRIGTKKIGAFCPSQLVVHHSSVNTYVKVEYWTKHLGHNCDMKYIYLKESEKKEIADKIMKGMTFSEILKSYKDSVSGPGLQRINCLSRYDLHRIVEQFKIKRNKIPESDDNLVNLWVKNMEEFGNDSPVAFFKKQGMEHEQLNSEDFMIVIMTKYQREMGIKYSGKNVCIDSIHGTSPHGFFLTALLTIDELSAVLPLAFCISSKTDEVSMTVFFESVKRLVGTIDSPVFMSNDDPTFYDAWEKIMAPASFQLFCYWHVDKCWRRNLDKISDKDKRASVYKALRMLLEESDVFEFESSIDNFVTELEEDALTREFAEYFVKNYLPRLKMWAFCYMRHLGISTVEHLYAMHTSLKNLFVDVGEDDNVYNSQVNIAIPALIKLTRDGLLRRLDELLECFPADWDYYKIRKGHRQGAKACKITALDNKSWSVKLFKRIDGHVVTENEACSQEACYLRCSTCNVCIHSYYCTCFDNLVNLNICGHVHACARFSMTVKYEIARKNKKMNGTITHGKEIVDTVVPNEEVIETSVQQEIPSSSKTLLTKQLNTIKNVMEFTEFSEEHASQLKNSFDAIISFMIMHGKSRKPFIQVPYKPTKNYLSTVNKKHEIQYQNQIVTTGQPNFSTVNKKPEVQYENQIVTTRHPNFSTVNKKPEIQYQNQIVTTRDPNFSTVNKKTEIQYQNQIITIGQPICLYPVKNLKQT